VVNAKAETGGLSMGRSVDRLEQPETFPSVRERKKEAPYSPVREPAPSTRNLTQERVAPPIARENPSRVTPLVPLPPKKLAEQREAFERARAEHRKANWEKYH